ncbi:hypothetical protein HMPREF9442_02731 [Paraprevotella xylaniphila YIT 11841]|uniref:Uncharacterized protein n=1 Tax=Paraprevotella xylaniphila YIT 11841 TaxID=762982 RepID=F3QWZ7_9BACT|nr:hypothetical protein HMPREF9442_02731 [Paraprevotella xylaniphila YIT 11841]
MLTACNDLFINVLCFSLNSIFFLRQTKNQSAETDFSFGAD